MYQQVSCCCYQCITRRYHADVNNSSLCVHRYHAVVHPFSTVQVDGYWRLRVIIIVIWSIPLILALPFLMAKSYQFSIQSHMGTLSLQICTDRFDEIDVILFGKNTTSSGFVRRVYFIFLFLVAYLLPSLIIGGACTVIIVCLCKPAPKQNITRGYERLVRKREKNKRKVS